MKFIDILRDANSNLLRSKARTALTVIAIFIGAMTLTITNGIGSGVSSYIDQQLGNLGAEDVLVVQPKMEDPFGTGPREYDEDAISSAYGGVGPMMPLLKDSDIGKITAVSGVVSAEPLLMVSPDYIKGPDETRYQLSISGFISGTNMILVAGEAPNNGSVENQIALPIDYIEVLGFDSAKDAVGGEVLVAISSAAGEQREVEATVVAVQEKTLMSLGGAVVNDAMLRTLSAIQAEGIPETAPSGHMAVIARVAADTSSADIESIKSELGDKGYSAQTFQDGIGQLKQIINAIIAVLNFFAIIALVAASFGIVNTLLMAVQERTKEIGLMKAMGLGRGKIFLLFSVEAILIGFWGSLLGSLAGIGIGQVANYVASDTFLKDLPGFSLTSFTPLSVAIIMAIIMAIAFIAGTIPARRASSKSPIEALRYE